LASFILRVATARLGTALYRTANGLKSDFIWTLFVDRLGPVVRHADVTRQARSSESLFESRDALLDASQRLDLPGEAAKVTLQFPSVHSVLLNGDLQLADGDIELGVARSGLLLQAPQALLQALNPLLQSLT
jgi:hypothetical protein